MGLEKFLKILETLSKEEWDDIILKFVKLGKQSLEAITKLHEELDNGNPGTNYPLVYYYAAGFYHLYIENKGFRKVFKRVLAAHKKAAALAKATAPVVAKAAPFVFAPVCFWGMLAFTGALFLYTYCWEQLCECLSYSYNCISSLSWESIVYWWKHGSSALPSVDNVPLDPLKELYDYSRDPVGSGNLTPKQGDIILGERLQEIPESQEKLKGVLLFVSVSGMVFCPPLGLLGVGALTVL